MGLRRENFKMVGKLAVITLGIVVALGFLSGAISAALDSVTAIL